MYLIIIGSTTARLMNRELVSTLTSSITSLVFKTLNLVVKFKLSHEDYLI